MINLTLRQLKYVDALAQQGHFGRAAEVCAVSQPALSMQIKELEDTLGLPLFERGARQVRLTAFGEDFVTRARLVLRAVDDLGDLAQSHRGGPAGRLRLGVIPTIAPYLLPAVMRALTDRYPHVDLHVRESLTQTLIGELNAGHLDCAIVALPVSEPGLAETPLFTEHLVLVRPAAEAGRPVPCAEDLAQMRLLLLEEGHCFRDQALSFCALRAGRPKEMLDGSSLSTLVQMVGAGLGVTLVPEMAVPVELRASSVAIARFPDPQPARTVGMIWRASSPLARQYGDLAEVVRAAAETARSVGEYP